MDYRYNETTGQVVEGDNLGVTFYIAPWIAATQQQEDDFLLDQAKESKNNTLKDALNDFEKTGYQYAGQTIAPVYSEFTTYKRKALVLAADGKNYKSLEKNNTDNEPSVSPTWWEEYEPIFKLNDRTTTNIILKNVLPIATQDKWIFGAKSNIAIDFSNATNWDAFFDLILPEKDRIMRKNSNYEEEIDLCITVAEVDVIVISFSP